MQPHHQACSLQKKSEPGRMEGLLSALYKTSSWVTMPSYSLEVINGNFGTAWQHRALAPVPFMTSPNSYDTALIKLCTGRFDSYWKDNKSSILKPEPELSLHRIVTKRLCSLPWCRLVCCWAGLRCSRKATYCYFANGFLFCSVFSLTFIHMFQPSLTSCYC